MSGFIQARLWCSKVWLRVYIIRPFKVLVRVLAFYSKNLNSNPAEVYNFSVKLLLKRTERNKKRPRLAHFWKYEENIISWSSHVGGFVYFLEARFSKSKIITSCDLSVNLIEVYQCDQMWPDHFQHLTNYIN